MTVASDEVPFDNDVYKYVVRLPRGSMSTCFWPLLQVAVIRKPNRVDQPTAFPEKLYVTDVEAVSGNVTVS